MLHGACIWCLTDSTDRDREHIFPEALGCPDHLMLPGTVVCKKCNNGLAHLDQVVVDDFDFLLVMHGVKRKRGLAPKVASRGNVYATNSSAGPQIFFNLDPVERMAPTGQRIGPFRGRTRDIRPHIQKRGRSLSSVEFDIPIGQDRKFARGLYKIALNSIAHMLGPDVARGEQFDWLREYVRHGGQRRSIMLTGAPDEKFRVAAFPPWKNADGDYAIELRIAFTNFLLDLSSDESLLPKFEQEAKLHFSKSEYSISPKGNNSNIIGVDGNLM